VRFALKISVCTVLIVAVLFAAFGHALIARSFSAALSFRVREAEAAYSAMASSLEAEISVLNVYYQSTTPRMLQEVLDRSTRSANLSGVSCALYDEGRRLLVATADGFKDRLAYQELTERRFVYSLIRSGDSSLLDTAGCVPIGMDRYFLSVRFPADDLFAARRGEVAVFVSLHLITVAVCIGAMLLISYFMSGPVRTLTRATKQIEEGQYDVRADVKSLDEIGDLAISFNAMAESIEQKVSTLEGYAKQQKDFVANFSHELKTPMTSIIGYADMLRSAELDEEDAFMASNFIFSEGKRLEALSLKLMDLVVLDKNEFELTRGYARRVLGHVIAVVTPMLEQHGLTLQTSIEQYQILYEKDLLLTLITNLIDNARKASEAGKSIELTGRKQQNRYRITVTDHGIGIPAEELSRITEAFFMVDKSRSRAQHGAGLGLAIGNRIAQLHGSELHFESEVGKGTSVWFDLPLPKDKRGKEASHEEVDPQD
jgi:signal transduction histidine kinase